MFGFGKEDNAKEEAEQRQIEAMKVSIEGALVQMKQQAQAGLTDRCEAGAKRLTEALKNPRSEEHTSELQSHHDLVCRLLLEKKKQTKKKKKKNDNKR